MEKIKETLKNSKISNNVNKYNNDTNVNGSFDKKYALDKSKFVPHTPESVCAIEIAEKFNDLNNFAFYMHVVKHLGIDRAYRAVCSVFYDVREKNETKYKIRSPVKYFAWKYRKGLF